MSIRFRTLALLLIVITAGCFQKHPSEDELLAMAKIFDGTRADAYSKRDLEAFMKHYTKTPDLVVVYGGKFLNGYDAWREEIQSQFHKIGASPVKLLLSDQHNIVKGDHVYSYGNYKIILPMKDAPDTIINGLFTSTKTLRDGQLVTVMETYSPTNPRSAKGIALLPGYTKTPGQGEDTEVGEISKQGSDFKIRYDIGHMAGFAADGVLKSLWRKTITVDGTRMTAVYSTDKELTVSFAPAFAAPANFYATINSEEELVDMLLMMGTYNRN